MALVLGTVVSTWQAVRARRAEHTALSERQRAEEALSTAQEVMDRFLTRVANVDLQNVPQMEHLRKELLHDALEFQEGFLAQRGDDPRLRYRAAVAYSQVAHIHYLLGEYTAAEASRRNAITLLEQCVRHWEDSELYRERLVDETRRLATTFSETARLGEAEDAFRRALEMARSLLSDFPRSMSGPRQVAAACDRLSLVVQLQGRLPEALRIRQQAVAMHERIIASSPAPENQRPLVESLRRLAGLLVDADRVEEGDAAIRRAIRLAEALTEEFPERAAYWEEVAVNHGFLAGHLQAAGREEEAVEARRRAIAILRRLSDEEPESQRYRSKQAAGYYELAVNHSRSIPLQESQLAIRALKKAMELSGEDRASDFLVMSMAEASLGNTEEALRRYERGVAILQEGGVHSDTEDALRFHEEAAVLLGLEEASKE